MKVDINIPVEAMGSIIGDITSRRGRVAELGDRNGFKYILAYIPLDEMFGYTTQLRSLHRAGVSLIWNFFITTPCHTTSMKI